MPSTGIMVYGQMACMAILDQNFWPVLPKATPNIVSVLDPFLLPRSGTGRELMRRAMVGKALLSRRIGMLL